MESYHLVKYAHYLAIFGIVASVILEAYMLKPNLSGHQIKRLSVVDGIYGLSAIIAVAAGLVLWLVIGKPADFYTSNPTFHLKLGLAILLGVLSLPPTIFFFKNRNHGDDLVAIPRWVTYCIRGELVILILLPLLAVLAAAGISLF